MIEVRLEPVEPSDFEAMLALRMEALRESLTRLGRFNPEVGRARLQAQFAPEHMRHLAVDGQRVGFFTLLPREASLHLQHLYLRPGAQGQGVGGWVIDHIKQRAREAGLPITLGALRESRANDFYQRHGFEVVQALEVDIEYRWTPEGGGA